jgi:hypothetical protein
VTDPYRAGTPTNWDDSLSSFRVEGDRGSYVLRGTCPRCGHEISKPLRDTVVAAFSGRQSGQTFKVTCNCTEGHGGAPSDTAGCGAFGGVLVRGSA